MAKLTKPPAIKNDAFKSQKWDEITHGRTFTQADAPMLSLLCQWYAIAEQCIADMDDIGQLIYENKLEDVKAIPQIDIMKKATGEIRQLNKQLGILDSEHENETVRTVNSDKIIQFTAKRKDRRSRAAN